MSTDPERSERIRELFRRAVRLPVAERVAFLRSACGGDAALFAELDSLLRHEPGPEPANLLATGGLAAQVLQLPPGTHVGPFVVERLLGSGASGDVYLATQVAPRRDVALKILRLGARGSDLERFADEGAALARLNHDHVAKVYQVGTGEDGRPWIAMELVVGRPITAFAEAARLTLRERLRLFASLCDALEHIHQNGFIHRDLKPDNVIVMEGSSPPSPKVLDFGIARALPRDLEMMSILPERDGRLVGTLEYASPEQLVGSSRLDVRTDLYAAGVILYELLTGRRPFRIADSGLAGFLDRVRSEPAPLPSRLLSRDTRLLDARASALGTTHAALLRALREDLDWVVSKALGKSPAERYASAGALRADLERHLAGQPVSAHPPTRGYVVRKFVARHRVGVAATVAVLLALGAGLASTVVQYRLAQRRMHDLEGLATDLVSSVNEIQDIPGAISAKERLVASAARTLDRLERQHLTLDARWRLADAYDRVGQLRADPYTASLGQTAAGVSDLCRSLTLRQAIHLDKHDVTSATALMHTAYLLALVIQSGAPWPPSPDSLLNAMIALGGPLAERRPVAVGLVRDLTLVEDLEAEYECDRGHWGRTLGLVRSAYARRMALAAADTSDETSARDVSQSLGRLAYATADPESARTFALGSLAFQERYFEHHPFSYRANLDLTFALRNAAYALQRCGRPAAALPLYRRCLALRRTMALSDSTDLRSRHQLANALEWLALGFVAVDQRDSALAAAREALAIRRQILLRPAPPPWAADAYRQSQRTLARAEAHAGHFERADSLYAAVCADTTLYGPLDGLRRWRDWVERAHANRRAGRGAIADSELALSGHMLAHLEASLRSSGADATPFADVALAYLHLAQARQGEPDAALGYLERAAALPGLEHEPREPLALVLNEWGCLLAERGDPAARDKLRGALAMARTEHTRGVIAANLARCARWALTGAATAGVTRRGGSPSLAGDDPTHDPYARLDLVLFRMLVAWGEHPAPPARRLLAQQVRAVRQSAADPGEAQPGVVRDRP